MSDRLQLVVKRGNAQCATLRVVSLLSVANLDDKLKHVGHCRVSDAMTKSALKGRAKIISTLRVDFFKEK